MACSVAVLGPMDHPPRFIEYDGTRTVELVQAPSAPFFSCCCTTTTDSHIVLSPESTKITTVVEDAATTSQRYIQVLPTGPGDTVVYRTLRGSNGGSIEMVEYHPDGRVWYYEYVSLECERII
jgi:hypothetical protein